MFERIMYTGLWVIILGIIGVGGWYAYKNINHDFVYESDSFAMSEESSNQVDIDFDDNNESATPKDETESVVETETETEQPSSAVVSSEYADLVAALGKLIEDNIAMKVGSRGTRVGTVQEFLNVFLDNQSTADNDFGPGTKARVIEFQTEIGITADGEPGPQTYQEMIDWLNEQ